MFILHVFSRVWEVLGTSGSFLLNFKVFHVFGGVRKLLGAPGCPRMPKDGPGGLQSAQEASSYVFSRVGETHDAESYVFYRAGEAPGGSFIRAGEAPCWRGPRKPQGWDP